MPWQAQQHFVAIRPPNDLDLSRRVIAKCERRRQVARYSVKECAQSREICQFGIDFVQMTDRKFEDVETTCLKQIMTSVGPLVG